MASLEKLLRKRENAANSIVNEADKLQRSGKVSTSIGLRKQAANEFKSIGRNDLAEQQIDIGLRMAEDRASELERMNDLVNAAFYLKEAVSIIETYRQSEVELVSNLKRKIHEMVTTETNDKTGEERKTTDIMRDRVRYDLSSFSAEDSDERKEYEQKKMETLTEIKENSFWGRFTAKRIIATTDQTHAAIKEGIGVSKEKIIESIELYSKSAQKAIKRREYVNAANDFIKVYDLYCEIDELDEANQQLESALNALREGEEFFSEKENLGDLFRVYEKMIKVLKSKSQEEEIRGILKKYVVALGREAEELIQKGHVQSAEVVLNRAMQLANEEKDEDLIRSVNEMMAKLRGGIQ